MLCVKCIMHDIIKHFLSLYPLNQLYTICLFNIINIIIFYCWFQVLKEEGFEETNFKNLTGNFFLLNVVWIQRNRLPISSINRIILSINKHIIVHFIIFTTHNQSQISINLSMPIIQNENYAANRGYPLFVFEI